MADMTDGLRRALVDAELGQTYAEARLKRAVGIITDLVDSDDCWFDHHGGCQAHGWLEPEPGEVCPHRRAKDFLARASTGTDGTDGTEHG